ncbi:MAG TPA: exonuclease SbcCD subunit D, partial [Rhodothermales bacterium]
MMKFLHIGDVHLDTTFLCRTETLRARLRDGLRTAFGRAVDCAVSEQVDAFLIAGDLFDNDNLSFRTEELLIDELKRLDANGITTVYVSGNHDPGNGRFAAIASHVAERFHYAPDGNVVVVDVPGRNGEAVGRIVGAGHATAREANNLAKRFPAATSGLPHVGLLHTMVAGARDAEGHDRYAPCAVEDLRKPGYRYWALGHIHVRQQVCDQSHAYYSGNVQGRNPRETGPKGGLLVTIRDGMNPEVAFRSFAPIQWLRLTVKDLSAVATVQELVSRI